MPSLHVYVIMFQDAWSGTQDSSPPHATTGRHRTTEHRTPVTGHRRDTGRQPEAKKNQGVDMIRTKKLRGRTKIEAHNDSVGEGGTKV